MLPLVSCIMPTRNRAAFAGEACQYFLAQDYPAKELIVLDDGDDITAKVLPKSPLIRYERCGPMSIGAKRNALGELARGSIILHWDDDDLSAPGRITRQVEELVWNKADIAGFHSMIFVNETERLAWKYEGSRFYILGTSMCYYKRALETRQFPDANTGEDMVFLTQFPVSPQEARRREMDVCKRFATDAGGTLVARIHGANTASSRAMVPQIAIKWENAEPFLRSFRDAA